MPSPAWSCAELAGRLCELTHTRSGAALALAFSLVLDAQLSGEPAAWVGTHGSTFYPPDAADCGVDLAALAVVRVPDANAAAAAVEHLLRSGAFGLVVLDLAATARLAQAAQSRLAGLAHKQSAVLLCVCEKPEHAAALGPLVSLRAHAQRRRLEVDRHACELSVVRDKRRHAPWRHVEIRRGPPGLR
ncbi:MAG: recombinase A [Planctomycetota bacterium]|nr:MAG: recombinase A [Planctomycetota bacterium]